MHWLGIITYRITIMETYVLVAKSIPRASRYILSFAFAPACPFALFTFWVMTVRCLRCGSWYCHGHALTPIAFCSCCTVGIFMLSMYLMVGFWCNARSTKPKVIVALCPSACNGIKSGLCLFHVRCGLRIRVRLLAHDIILWSACLFDTRYVCT